jgi:branched-chain amino acid transport system ATP-binding protein
MSQPSDNGRSPLLNVEAVDAFYGEMQVLRQASLQVKRGEVVAIFGPNGHGKSTLMKNIAGLCRPAAGKIMLEGVDISGWPCEKIVETGVALIPEDRLLFPHMSVMDNLICGAVNKNARPHFKANLKKVFDLFPRLAERTSQLANSLSGGEARMLAVGRGMMSHADMLLVDEPSVGLSPLMKQGVFDTIATLRDEGRVGILVVEQEVDYGLAVADRIYVMTKGRILFERTAAEAKREEIERAYFRSEKEQ